MARDNDSLNLEQVEAVVEQMGDGDLALVQPEVLLAFFYALQARINAGAANTYQ